MFLLFFQKLDAKMEPWDNLILLSYHRCRGNRGLLILLSEMKVKTGKKRKKREPRQEKNPTVFIQRSRDVFVFLVGL